MPTQRISGDFRSRITRTCLVLSGAVVGLLLIAPASADEGNDLCGKHNQPAEHFVGSYSMEVGSGYVTNGKMKIRATTTDTDTPTISVQGGNLILDDSAGTISGQVAGTEEPRWEWPAGVGKPPVSADDLAVVAGCENDRLPRIVLSGTGTSADGKPLDYGYRLVETRPGLLVGLLHWQGGGFSSKRWVTLERTGDR